MKSIAFIGKDSDALTNENDRRNKEREQRRKVRNMGRNAGPNSRGLSPEEESFRENLKAILRKKK